jgi:sugar phosphate isomerase/epimerase
VRRVTGLEHLTLLGVPPPDLVTVAAGAGFDAVGLRVSPATDDDVPWPMKPGSPMLAETALRSADLGIPVLDVEAIRLGPRPEPFTPVLETAAALGAGFVNAVCEDPDLGRFAASFARLVEAARPYGVRPVVEFMAYRSVRTLDDATAVVAGSGGGGILIDALHVQRCGVSLGALRALDPALVTYVQLCDAPAAAPPDEVAEARAGRRLPGDGELPLRELLAALPAGIPVAVEAPQQGATGDPAAFAGRARRALESVLSPSRPARSRPARSRPARANPAQAKERP